MWTDEQLRAIEESGHNILVSAGAGSGKTAVLTERVIRKLKKGINIDEFLILTFTKAAAKEMKERIYDGIKESQLNDQLSKLDLAYITTFDSFALSILKKYHYKLGLPKNIEIEQGGLIEIQKRKLLDEIFEEYYDKEDIKFNNFIINFCNKDDVELKQMILQVSDKLDLKYDKILYLNNYLNKEFQESSINQKISNYEKLIIDKINEINQKLQHFYFVVEEEYFNNFKSSILCLDKNNYDEIIKNLNIKLPNLPKGSVEEAKESKEEISQLIKEIISLCSYDSKQEMKEYILKTKDTVDIIIKILIELERRLEKYKEKNNLYSFSDVAKKAIFLLETEEEIRLELKNQFHEIMIDEYQDTSDIQEKFISLIQNNNVYMVGDIKQSIYRFRNANPYIFKNKYEEYKQHKNGEKIDLTKNFRSREEVIFNINEIFKELMDDNYGGADYRKEHQMIFGNYDYKKTGENNQNNFLEIIRYPETNEYSKEEIEAFVIARDIKRRIENKEKVMDKKTKTLKLCNYQDFVILIDKSKNFSIYKKVFEYLNIPLMICRDNNIIDNINISIIKNILELAVLEKEKNYNKDYIFYFMSIARSYLFEYSDEFIFNCIKENKYDSSLLEKIHKIIPYFDSNISIIIDKIIEEFDVLSNIIKIGNIEENITVLDYLKDVSETLELMGYDVIKWKEYLNDLINNKISLSCSFQKESTNSVKIMTIHGSKGLEYPICYYSGLYSKFNIRECSEKILFDDGFVVPVIEDSVRYTIEKELLKQRYYKEEISERIRLFYVALTRAREKMIMLIDSKELKQKSKNNWRSFKDMLGSIDLEKYMVSLSLEQVNPTKEYSYIVKNEVKNDFNNSIVVNEISIRNEYVEQKSFSKNSLHTKDDINKMKLGTKIHSILEVIDFKNPSFEDVDIEDIYKQKILKLLNNELLKGDKYYREYEFEYEDNNIFYHGIIDLMVETEDTIRIIDYKLKYTDDDSYLEQLNGYKKYISSLTDKKIEVYLYSILDEQINKLF